MNITIQKTQIAEIKKYIVSARNMDALQKESGIAPRTIKTIIERGSATESQLSKIADFIRRQKQIANGIID